MVLTRILPFMPTPQTFRMEAAAGQALRLLYTGDNLPQDRESVFWFSFSRLPSVPIRTIKVRTSSSWP